jgi:uncharacterized protein
MRRLYPLDATMRNERRPQRTRSAARAWLAGTVLSLTALTASPQASLEDLGEFPHATVHIVSGRNYYTFDVWIADTPARQEQGLMFVHELPPDQGMLFPQQPPRAMSMWMKNTLIELDMLFIGTDGRIERIAARAQPQSLATISSGAVVSAVLEIRGGEAQRRHLAVGDRIDWTH